MDMESRSRFDNNGIYTTMGDPDEAPVKSIKRVAIIGAGASGLVAAK
jgi:hypothetical protein